MERKIGLRHQSLPQNASAAQALSLVTATNLQRELSISWGESTARVTAYWRALGVSDEDQLTALTRRVMQRVDALGPETAAADLAMLAVEETRQMVDEWLTSLLDCEHPVSAQKLAMARVALLSGTLPQWPAVLLDGDDGELRLALRGATVVPIPEPAELTMEIQQIQLFLSSLFPRWQRCLRLLTAGIGKVLKIFGKH